MKNILSRFKQEKVVGLYIGQDTVDLVVMKGTLQGPRLVKFGQAYIYPKNGKIEEIVVEKEENSQEVNDESAEPQKTEKMREDYIVDAVQRVLKENNVKATKVVTAISSEEAMVRYFQMPKIPKQEWSSAINFEAKRYIPFRMEDVSSDFQVIQREKDSNTMDVIFVAGKQKAIENFVHIFERAGVRPVIIEPAPFSLIRSFNAVEQIDKKVNTAIVNIETKSANINILKNGVPYIIRDIPLDLETSGETSLEPIFEKLLAEIKLSFDFYEKQFPTEAIDKIIIYSQLALENWHELVAQELQIQVEVGDPLRGIKIKKGLVPPKLAISFGLALRGISEPYIDINLYKEKLLVYKQKELFLKLLFAEASGAVLLLIILKLLCVRIMAPLTQELQQTLSERPKVEVSIKEDNIEKLEGIKNKMHAKWVVLDNIISNRTYFSGRLMDLA
ncbi:MAG: pilus assembly protein PilM, partial [Candidatus Omnitrophota bacterium]|nr:pilus assembly protein PilM [Candidatus Omnitrophota bacterium]